MTEQTSPDRDSGPQYVTRPVNGRDVLFDKEGFLVDADDWSRELAVQLAVEAGILDLNEQHWRVIAFLRDYYAAYGKAPMARDLKEGTGMTLLQIERLFAGGLKKGARRLAGLPNPRGCM